MAAAAAESIAFPGTSRNALSESPELSQIVVAQPCMTSPKPSLMKIPTDARRVAVRSRLGECPQESNRLRPQAARRSYLLSTPPSSSMQTICSPAAGGSATVKKLDSLKNQADEDTRQRDARGSVLGIALRRPPDS